MLSSALASRYWSIATALIPKDTGRSNNKAISLAKGNIECSFSMLSVLRTEFQKLVDAKQYRKVGFIDRPNYNLKKKKKNPKK